jgi:hypothetical protein
MAIKDIVRGPHGVRSRRVRQDDRTRERIKAAMIINRLQDCIAGRIESKGFFGCGRVGPVECK